MHDLKPKFDLNTDLFNVIFGGGVLKKTLHVKMNQMFAWKNNSLACFCAL